MRDQVMIKSHTGAMVVPRPGMDVKGPLSFHGGKLSHPLNNGGWEFEDGTFTGSLDWYTMVHCPIEFDDAYEFFHDTNGGEWLRGDWVEKENVLAGISLYPKLYRHASPDLRDAPDYQKQVTYDV